MQEPEITYLEVDGKKFKMYNGELVTSYGSVLLSGWPDIDTFTVGAIFVLTSGAHEWLAQYDIYKVTKEFSAAEIGMEVLTLHGKEAMKNGYICPEKVAALLVDRGYATVISNYQELCCTS
jgi:hypothetical protein